MDRKRRGVQLVGLGAVVLAASFVLVGRVAANHATASAYEELRYEEHRPAAIAEALSAATSSRTTYEEARYEGQRTVVPEDASDDAPGRLTRYEEWRYEGFRPAQIPRDMGR